MLMELQHPKDVTSGAPLGFARGEFPARFDGRVAQAHRGAELVRGIGGGDAGADEFFR